MIVGVDSRGDFRAPAAEVLAGVHCVGVQDAGEFYLELDGSVLVEYPVYCIFVVGCGKDVGDDEFAAASDDGGIVAEVRMLEENTGVFFVDADCIFDR